MFAGLQGHGKKISMREDAMKTLISLGMVTASLLMASSLTPARAADMTFERALNASKEPQN